MCVKSIDDLESRCQVLYLHGPNNRISNSRSRLISAAINSTISVQAHNKVNASLLFADISSFCRLSIFSLDAMKGSRNKRFPSFERGANMQDWFMAALAI